MTYRARRARAERLLIRRIAGEEPADKAWRVVEPNSKSTDSSAAELTRRELRWLREIQAREAEERLAQRQQFSAPFNPQFSYQPPTPEREPEAPSEPAPAPKMKRCEGVAGRPCEQEVSAVRNRKRCASCAREHRRWQKRGPNRAYYRRHRVRLCKELRTRRIERAFLAERKAEQERIAKLPKVVREPGGGFVVEDPATGKREPLRPDKRDPYQVWWPTS